MKQQDETPPVHEGAAGSGQTDQLPAVLKYGIAFFAVAMLVLLAYRSFDPDEFEHVHAAWTMSKGLVLYRDFFEHHTPWYYVLLRPLFRWFHVDASFDSGRHFLSLARGISVALAVGSTALVAAVGRAWKDRRVGLTAAFLFVSQPFFLKKGIEIRPDVLAVPLFLASLWALLRGISPQLARARWGWFWLAGLALGGAVMCTQKMVFVLPGLLVGLGLWVMAADRVARAAHVILFLLGVVVPGVATWAAFLPVHAADLFVINNFLLNARWTSTPTGQLIRLVLTSGPVLALAAYRAVVGLPRLMRAESRDPGEALLLCVAVWLFVAVALIPAAQMQYYLMPLPVVCLLAARGLDDLALRAGRRLWPWALAALSLLPVVNLGMDLASTNRKQLARLRQVAETTKPTDSVLDGWQGTGVFRPHAFYYFFIHDEILLMMPRERFNAFMDDLEAGRSRPALIALDRRVAALGPRFLAFVNAHYSTRDGFFFYWAG